MLKLSGRFLADDSGHKAATILDKPEPPPPVPYATLRYDPLDVDANGGQAIAAAANATSHALESSTNHSVKGVLTAARSSLQALNDMDRPFRAKDHVATDIYRFFTKPKAAHLAQMANTVALESPPLTPQECERVVKKIMYVVVTAKAA